MGEGPAATSPMTSPTPPIRFLCWLPLRRLRLADVQVAQRRRGIFSICRPCHDGQHVLDATATRKARQLTAGPKRMNQTKTFLPYSNARWLTWFQIARSRNLSASGASFTCNFKGCAAQFRAFRQRLILERRTQLARRVGREPGGYRNWRCQTPGVRTGRPDPRGEAKTSLSAAGGSFLLEGAKVLLLDAN